jgi:autotransporter-associated beta strand protein
VHDRLRAGSATLRAGALVASLALLPNLAQAQSSFTWVGSGSTTDDGLYRTGTNWSNPPSGAPPVAAGQSAIFDANGSATVTVNGAAISPNSWTFTAGAQSYTISGAALNFSQAGSVGGLIDNANAGQTITIANTIGETVAGVQVQLTGQSTLVLSGNNSYSGGTTVGNFGTLVVGNNNAVGSGTVTLSAAIFQAEGSGNLTFGNNFNISDMATGNVIDANGVRLTLNGNIGGTGALTVQDSGGGGVVVLNGANTYTGATTVCFCGTLQLGDAGHTASIVGAVTNEGLLKVFNANMSGVTSITNAVARRGSSMRPRRPAPPSRTSSAARRSSATAARLRARTSPIWRPAAARCSSTTARPATPSSPTTVRPGPSSRSASASSTTARPAMRSSSTAMAG